MSNEWVSAIRNSHDRFVSLVQPLSADEVSRPSYASEWTIAQVASHLGSQSEIFMPFLAAGVAGTDGPGNDFFRPIWDRWDALAPIEQAQNSIAANEAFVAALEAVTDAQAATFSLNMFGRDLDLDGFAAMRLGEHAVHTWDIAVALDPSAEIAPDAANLIIDRLAGPAGRGGKPVEGGGQVIVRTTDPERRFLIALEPSVSLDSADGEADGDDVELTADQFIRLVYGRLDEETSGAEDSRLATLRQVFPGF